MIQDGSYRACPNVGHGTLRESRSLLSATLLKNGLNLRLGLKDSPAPLGTPAGFASGQGVACASGPGNLRTLREIQSMYVVGAESVFHSLVFMARYARYGFRHISLHRVSRSVPWISAGNKQFGKLQTKLV